MKHSVRDLLKRKHVPIADHSGSGAHRKETTADMDAMDTATNSIRACESTLSELQGGIAARNRELEALTLERAALIEDAALKLNGADKLLADIDTRIAHRQRDAQLKAEAITQVERRLLHAREELARQVEVQRQLDLGVLARNLLGYSTEFTLHMRGLANANQAIQDTLRTMTGIADNAERNWISQLSAHGPYQRAMEHAGLRLVFQVHGYPGPREHIVPLHVHFQQMLDRWLTVADEQTVAIQKQLEAQAEQQEAEQHSNDLEPRQIAERIN